MFWLKCSVSSAGVMASVPPSGGSDDLSSACANTPVAGAASTIAIATMTMATKLRTPTKGSSSQNAERCPTDYPNNEADDQLARTAVAVRIAFGVAILRHRRQCFRKLRRRRRAVLRRNLETRALATAIEPCLAGDAGVGRGLADVEHVAITENLGVRVVPGTPGDEVRAWREAGLERRRHLEPVRAQGAVACIHALALCVLDVDKRPVRVAADVRREVAGDAGRRRLQDSPRRGVEAQRPRVCEDLRRR